MVVFGEMDAANACQGDQLRTDADHDGRDSDGVLIDPQAA
jgi:hypothetical protein